MDTVTPATTPEEKLRGDNAELRARLEEAEETLRAIRMGEVDSLLVETVDGPHVFSLASADAASNWLRGEVLAQVSDAVIVIDPEQRVILFNVAAERQYRVTADAVLGRKLSGIYTSHWPSAEEEAAAWTALREHGELRAETVQRLHDGRELYVESSLTMLRAADGADAGMVAAIRDITERKRSAAELKRVNVLLDTLLQTAPIGFCFLDLELRYVRINERLAEINGIAAEAHLGRRVSEIVPALAEVVQEATGHILATGECVLNHEVSGESPAAPGVTRFWSQSWYPVRDDEGKVLGFGGIVEEITARKQAEAKIQMLNAKLEQRVIERTMQLQHAVEALETEIAEVQRLKAEVLRIAEEERLRVAADLHDGICQEIVGSRFVAHMVSKGLETSDHPQAAAARHVEQTLGAIADHTRQVARGMNPVVAEGNGLMEALRQLAGTTARARQIRCTFRCPTPVLIADARTANEIYRIAQEAIHNAVRHGNAKRIAVRLSETSTETRLVVMDDGCGMPAEITGTGMGLRVMRWRADLIGGRLLIQPRKRGGTEVICTIDRQENTF